MSTLTLQVNVHTQDPDTILCVYRRNRFGTWELASELADFPRTANPRQVPTENRTAPQIFKFILRDSPREHHLRIAFHNGETKEETLSVSPRTLQAMHQYAVIDWHI